MLKYIILIFFIYFPYFIVSIKHILQDTYIWQIKEYRLDRIISNLKYFEAKSNRNTILTLTKVTCFIVLLIFFYFPESQILIISAAVSYFIYLIETDAFVKLFRKGKLIKPRLKSIRNLLIICGSIAILLIPVILTMLWIGSLSYEEDIKQGIFSLKPLESTSGVSFNQVLPQVKEGLLIIPLATLIVLLITLIGLTSDLITSLLVSFFSLVTEPFAQLRRKNIVYKARKKIKTMSSLKIIGITGSYGKTTTKEILFQILKEKLKTVRTPENKNTEVGIAQTILKEINESTEVFIAEMGAYKKGEIKSSVDLAAPDIAIVTGLNQQHLSLFGSIEALFQAKYEIIQGLKAEGVAIFNGDNEYCLRMAEKTEKRKIIFFSTDDASRLSENNEDKNTSFLKSKNIFIKNIHEFQDKITFYLDFKGKEFKIDTNIIGKHNALNLTAAVIAANEAGLKIDDIIKIINTKKFKLPYLNIYKGINKSIIIDDGYNSNPIGFEKALEELARHKTKGKKWILTQGIIELGKEKSAVYHKLSQKILMSSDALITTDKYMKNTIQELNKKFTVYFAEDIRKVDDIYIRNVMENDICLIEGAMPKEILDLIYVK